MTFQKGNQFGKLGGRRKGYIPWNKGLKLDKEKYPNVGFQVGNRFKGMEGKKHSEKTKIEISAHHQGISSKEWSGFRQKFLKRLRNNSKWKIWRELVFLRDNFTCQNSNCKYCDNQIGVFLHPHHIKPISLYFELVYNIDNGITYCKDFHLKEIHNKIKMEVN